MQVQLETDHSETFPLNSSNIFTILLLIVMYSVETKKYTFSETLQQTLPAKTTASYWNDY